MARKRYNEEEVLRSLSSKNDCLIDRNHQSDGTAIKTISIIKSKIYDKDKDCMIPNPHCKNDLGNGSWGKIDFLTKVCGYSIIYVKSF